MLPEPSAQPRCSEAKTYALQKRADRFQAWGVLLVDSNLQHSNDTVIGHSSTEIQPTITSALRIPLMPTEKYWRCAPNRQAKAHTRAAMQTRKLAGAVPASVEKKKPIRPASCHLMGLKYSCGAEIVHSTIASHMNKAPFIERRFCITQQLPRLPLQPLRLLLQQLPQQEQRRLPRHLREG